MVLSVAAGLGLWLLASLPQASPRAGSPAAAAETAQPHAVNFDYEMPGLPVPHWSIAINADGSGRYAELPPQQKGGPAAPLPLHVGEVTRQRLEAGYAKVRAGVCDANLKHVANTGIKKLSFQSGSGEWVSCTFNYSDDKGLMDAVKAFEAIAQTLQDGVQLEHSHRFDRLGLDAEIDELTRQVGQGEAIELQNIAPVLQDIVQDERVMERVRRKSGRLLQDAGLGLGSDRPPVVSGTASDVAPNP